MRAAAILTGPSTHLDHLGILSAHLHIPLIVTDEKTEQLAKEFYPDLTPIHREMHTLTLEFFAQNFDVLFETGKFWALEMGPFLELLFRKKMRFVFCPHGNSDKGHSLKTHTEQDISLVYGDHLFDHLHRTGAAQKIRRILRTGNYRYTYYLKHKSFYDTLTQKFLSKKKTILYAPTWNGKENPTTFFTAIDALINELSPTFNLIIKLHPYLIDDHPAEVYAILSRYEGHPSARFLTEFPAIYPLLSRCDLYLGDHSSIGYDFLAFNKPLYFLDSSPSPLQKCGLKIPFLNRLCSWIEETLEYSQLHYETERKKTYLYAFGEEIESTRLKEELASTLMTLEVL